MGGRKKGENDRERGRQGDVEWGAGPPSLECLTQGSRESLLQENARPLCLMVSKLPSRNGGKEGAGRESERETPTAE
jgi:hypothetical protein